MAIWEEPHGVVMGLPERRRSTINITDLKAQFLTQMQAKAIESKVEHPIAQNARALVYRQRLPGFGHSVTVWMVSARSF